MTDLPNYVVIRAAKDLPPGFLPEHLDGRWFDIGLLTPTDGDYVTDGTISVGVAVPSGRFETREDGAVAEIYEVRP